MRHVIGITRPHAENTNINNEREIEKEKPKNQKIATMDPKLLIGAKNQDIEFCTTMRSFTSFIIDINIEIWSIEILFLE